MLWHVSAQVCRLVAAQSQMDVLQQRFARESVRYPDANPPEHYLAFALAGAVDWEFAANPICAVGGGRSGISDQLRRCSGIAGFAIIGAEEGVRGSLGTRRILEET